MAKWQVILFSVLVCVGGVLRAEDACKVYTITDVADVKSQCPIVTDDDYKREYQECVNTKKKQKFECLAAEEKFQSYLSDLDSNYQEYLYLKQNKKSAKKDDTSDDKDSKSSDERMITNKQHIDRILTQIENFQISQGCGTRESFLRGLLPVLSFVSPASGFYAGTAVGLTSRLVSIFHQAKSTLAEKLALCKINDSFQNAREQACQSTVYSGPSFTKLIEANLTVEKKWEQQAFATDTFKVCNGYESIRDSYLKLKALDFDVPADDVIAKMKKQVAELSKNLSCPTGHPQAINAKEICEQVALLTKGISDPDLVNLDSKSDTRKEKVGFIGRVLNGKLLKLSPPNSWNYSTDEKRPEIEEMKKITGDSASNINLVFGLLPFEWAGKPMVFDKLIRTPNDYAPMLKDACLMLPSDIHPENFGARSDGGKKNFCQATACIWNKAKTNFDDLEQFKNNQIGYPTEDVARVKDAKNVTGWDFIGPQSVASYTDAGKGSFQSWDTVLKSKTSVSTIAHFCAGVAVDPCSINCYQTMVLPEHLSPTYKPAQKKIEKVTE